MSTSVAPQDPFEDAAKTGYSAYFDARHGRDERGFALPVWDALPEILKVPWRAVARAIAESVTAPESVLPTHPPAALEPQATVEPIFPPDSTPGQAFVTAKPIQPQNPT